MQRKIGSKTKRVRVYVRHYCMKCGSRLFPWDKYDLQTLDPHPKYGEVLLRSANATRLIRTAWCWSCNRWMACSREDEKKFLQRYLDRQGVVVREKPKTKRKKAS